MYFDVSTMFQINFQDSATYGMEMLIQLHNYVMFFNFLMISLVLWFFFEIISVSVFINWITRMFYHDKYMIGEYFYVIVNNLVKAMLHLVALEILWTLFPIFILILIAIPSLSMLYYFSLTFEPAYVVNVIGHQWYWTYEHIYNHLDQKFPDNEIFDYETYTIFKERIAEIDYSNLIDLASDQITEKLLYDSVMETFWDLSINGFRLLEVDHPLFLPVDVPIKIFLTSDDVLHSWAVPSLGIKVDCVPGRINSVEMKIARSGIYYGQCSELCGAYHGFMPISVVALPKIYFF